MSAILIHHQGKGGDQRGTSGKEDILDTVISLKRPADYRSDQGARFEVHFTKARGLIGEGARPFEAQLMSEGEALVWSARDIENVRLDQVQSMLADKMSIRDIAEELGISKSSVHRLKNRLVSGDMGGGLMSQNFANRVTCPKVSHVPTLYTWDSGTKPEKRDKAWDNFYKSVGAQGYKLSH
ncbi:MAG: helix-turn-helix domain-containing protein [Desulfovibrio sp.]|jgi:hypothetical protein|nr:helix-turn-helix domain-containing protein [Desulfovibrio sp.]